MLSSFNVKALKSHQQKSRMMQIYIRKLNISSGKLFAFRKAQNEMRWKISVNSSRNVLNASGFITVWSNAKKWEIKYKFNYCSTHKINEKMWKFLFSNLSLVALWHEKSMSVWIFQDLIQLSLREICYLDPKGIKKENW